MIPQIIYLSILFLALLYTAHMHGEIKEGKHNIFSSLISAAMVLSLLYWGGFFNAFTN